GDRLVFHPQVASTELLSRSAEHDVGLALEQGGTLNRAICTTNKLFLYLLSGLAAVATDVPGQRSILGDLPFATLYKPGDVEALAAQLASYQRDPFTLRRAKASALECARTRWNWEVESARLINVVRDTLDAPGRTAVAHRSGATEDGRR